MGGRNGTDMACYMAGIWQTHSRYKSYTGQLQVRYSADMGRYSAAIAKDCRYDKSLRYRSENLPERCTKIRPYKEKIQA